MSELTGPHTCRNNVVYNCECLCSLRMCNAFASSLACVLSNVCVLYSEYNTVNNVAAIIDTLNMSGRLDGFC